MRRLICLFLVLALVLSIVPATSATDTKEEYFTVKVEYSDNIGQLENLNLMVMDNHVFVDAKMIAERFGYQYKEGDSAIAIYNPESTEDLPRKVIVFNFNSTQISNLVLNTMIDSYVAPFESIKNSSGTWIPFEYSLLLMNSSMMLHDDMIFIDFPAKNITDLFVEIAKQMQLFQFDYADDFGHSDLDIKVLAGSSRLINVFNGLLTMDGDSWLVLFQQFFGNTDAYDKKYAEDIALLLCTESDKELNATIESVGLAIDLLSEDGALGTILSRMDTAYDADVGILYELCEKLLKEISDGNGPSVTYNRTYQALETALDKQMWFSETGEKILQIQKRNSALVPSWKLKVVTRILETCSYAKEFQNQDTFAVGALSHYLDVNGFDQNILNTMKSEMADYYAEISGDLASYTTSRLKDNLTQWVIDDIPIDEALGTQASIVLFAWDLASTFLPLVRDGLSSADSFDLSMYSQIIQSDAFLTYKAERDKTFSTTSSITAENLYKVAQCCFVYLKACYITREAALNSLNGKTDEILDRIQPLIDYQNQINEEIAKMLVALKRATQTNDEHVYGVLPNEKITYSDIKLLDFLSSLSAVPSSVADVNEDVSSDAYEGDTSEMYKAYYSLCVKRQSQYGIGSVDNYCLYGLSVVRLVDFDGDGKEELYIAYWDKKSGQSAYEIWSYDKGSAKQIYYSEDFYSASQDTYHEYYLRYTSANEKTYLWTEFPYYGDGVHNLQWKSELLEMKAGEFSSIKCWEFLYLGDEDKMTRYINGKEVSEDEFIEDNYYAMKQEYETTEFLFLLNWDDESQRTTLIETERVLNCLSGSLETEQSTSKFNVDDLKSAQVGDYIEFGSYEQDNNLSNGKEAVEWLVLAREGNQLLVISRYELDAQPFNTKRKDVVWAGCSLRTWLNETFLMETFAPAEQAMIVHSVLPDEKQKNYRRSPSTTDQVFLLSMAEAESYFGSDEERKCPPTAYAISQGASGDDYNTDASGVACCMWWLRNPGLGDYYPIDRASMVTAAGLISDGGLFVDNNLAVRPALWIDIGT